MDSRITIPYLWTFKSDPNVQIANLKKGDLIVGFVRSPGPNVALDITSTNGSISFVKKIAYNTGGGIVDSIVAVVYMATSDVPTTLTFSSDHKQYAISAIFRNAELVAFESSGFRKGSPEQTLPTNKYNGMGILLVNRFIPSPTTSSYTQIAKIEESTAAGGAHMLTLDNIRTQSAQPPTISHGGGDYSAVVAILLAPATMGPNKPTNLSPSGTESSPAMVGTAFTISWSYSSPDVGSAQKYYQIAVRKKIDNSLAYDTGAVLSGSSTHKTPLDFLQANTEYYYTVRVWDHYSNVSLEEIQYIKTYKAPTATPLSPVGSSDKPGGASLAPTLKWEYYDPQGIEPYSFEIRIIRQSDNSLVKTPALVISSQSQYDVPLGDLKAGELYTWTVRVISKEHIGSVHSPTQYFITNTPPSAPTLTLPVNTYRTGTNPTFEAIAGSDPEDDRQGFVIEASVDEQFVTSKRIFNSKTSYKNWSYYNGHEWKPFDDYTLSNDIVKGNKIRFDMLEEASLVSNKTYYWRMAGVDGTTEVAGTWSKTQSIRVGNVLQFQLKEPISDKVEAHRLVMNAVYKIADDGATPARLLVEVSNNAADESPTWEDMTEAFLNRDYLELQNRVKQAEKWGLNVRITIFANDSLGPIEFDAFGFSYD
ncbi:hypothetical protein EEL31_21590 [Brevibacillus laterosporus]|nr:hypothetical protein [Brevibacillus laterosporus]TPG70781.1 hypothetical protein EEL31_21590 [Brevibacillus laterosporus]